MLDAFVSEIAKHGHCDRRHAAAGIARRRLTMRPIPHAIQDVRKAHRSFLRFARKRGEPGIVLAKPSIRRGVVSIDRSPAAARSTRHPVWPLTTGAWTISSPHPLL